VARVTGWAATQQVPVDEVATDVGFALNGHRGMFLALLGDRSVGRIVVEHRDRLCRFGSEYVEAALAGHGRELVDSAEIDDDLVRDMTEMLTGRWAWLYGEGAGADRAERAVAAAVAEAADHVAA
jgi:predicted site-specific integrase-resolvase